jgi:Putative beta-barrel porin-2, OmpL-like. bbp2
MPYYEYRASPWIINPSFQLTLVPHNPEIGVFKTTSTIGGAIRASYAVTNNFFMVGRTEFIGQNGNTRDGAANLLYGPDSQAWLSTLTPTYQYGMFFGRPEFSYVRAINYASGSVFGSSGTHPTQVRGLIEFGMIW